MDKVREQVMFELQRGGDMEYSIKIIHPGGDYIQSKFMDIAALVDFIYNHALEAQRPGVGEECPYKVNGGYSKDNLQHQITNGKCVLCGQALASLNVGRVPTVEEIEGILEIKFGKDYLRDIHTGDSIDMTDEIKETAQSIFNLLTRKE